MAADIEEAHLTGLLARRGDLDGLRVRADNGDREAARELVLLLYSRGDLDGANRFAENAQTARQDFGWSSRSQAGSARRAGSLSLVLPGLQGDGVDDLPVAEGVAVPAEVRLQVDRGLGDPRSGDEPRPASSRSARFAAGSMPASATTTMASSPCRAWNCLMTGKIVSFSAWFPSKQPISRGKAVPAGEQPDHDLRAGRRSLLQPAFRRASSCSASKYSVVTSYKIRGDISAGPRVRDAQLCDPAAVAAVRAAAQGAAHRLAAGGLAAQVRQDPPRVQDRGRLHDPGQDQVRNTSSPRAPNPRPAKTPSRAWNSTREPVDTTRGAPAAAGALPGGFRVEQCRRGLPRHEPGPRRGGLDSQVKRALGRIGQPLPRPLKQDPQLGLGMRGPHVRHDLPTATVVPGDLHGRRPGCRPHPPNPRHSTEPRAPISA
jgi:hypothetical protein